MLVKATFRQRGSRNLETRAEVLLKILDQNDLLPLFIPSKYDVEISDDTPPMTEVVRVKASDADEGLNGQVYYSMMTPAPRVFSVHPVSGSVLLLQKVDVRKTSEYEFLIQAKDRASRIQDARGSGGTGQAQAASTATVKVRIRQANRHPPEIRLKNVQQNVIRDSESPQTVALVQIFDEDDGPHGEVGLIKLAPVDFALSCFRVLPSGIQGTYRVQTVVGALFPPPGTDYNMTLFVEDKGVPPRNSTLQLTFHLRNGNDSGLAFVEEAMELSVKESLPVGTIVGVARLKKLVNGVTFALRNEGPGVPFEVGSETGVISLTDDLDFETLNSYAFEIVASDSSEATAVTSVSVTVIDENDNIPIFANESRNLVIEIERTTALESAIGSVKASDADSGNNGRVSFQGSSGDSPFIIDQWTGDIILRNKIKPSDQGWVLVVRAMDWGAPLRRETETCVTIRIKGSSFQPISTPAPHPVNQHSPKFQRTEHSMEVPENAIVGTVFLTVTATDKDFGYNGLVQYVLEENGEGLFDIDAYTGEVSVLKSLALANLRGNTIIVKAVDCGMERKSNTAKIRITILDVNDHDPVFDQLVYKISVREDEKVGKELLRVRASDADEGINAEVFFLFQVPADEFKIDGKTGVISIGQPLDRERRSRYDLQVKAEDGGFPPRGGVARVEVEVLDINDNPPKCHMRMSKVQVAEDWPEGALVTCLSASDPDSGSNGEFGFTLDPGMRNLPFRMEEEAGCLRVTKRLNFEERPLYNLTVEVTDRGLPQYSSICHLLVELVDLDENFHPPAFVKEDGREKVFSLAFSVSENEEVGREVGSVRAVDPDDPESPCGYSVVSGDGMGLFTVDSQGVIRTSGVLDRERAGSYWLTIKAEDSASVPRSAFMEVYVEVRDRNDHAPRPLKPVYFVSVEENSPPGTLVTRIEARDPDRGAGNNGNALLYQIIRGDPQSFFTINSKTGYITTHKRKLDRETQAMHELEVEIRDGGDVPLRTVVLVVVDVLDANDHTPHFQRKIYNFDVPPVQDGDTASLARVIAADEDTGPNADLKYSVSDDSDKFGIRPKTGEIYANSALHPDETYALTVSVSDGDSESEARVMLAVLSFPNQTLGNGPPVLVNSGKVEFHVSDEEKIGEPIGILEATADGQQLWFDITDGNVNDMFSLRKDTGELQLAMNLKSTNITRYDLSYSVSDGISTARGKARVEVRRRVEERPVFEQSEYETELREKAPVGTVVEQMDAGLESQGDHSILYFLHETENPASAHVFKVEARTGRVIVVGDVDYEVCQEHRIVVGARFQNLITLATLIIKVKDVNDFEPTFLKSYYEAKVYETASVGHAVLHVLAVDKDSGTNGKLTYSILSGNEEGSWKLDSQSGRISVAQQLSLDHPESVLVVKVSDSGSPPFSATTTAQILVIMAEGSLPRFTQDTYFLSVSELELPGTFLGSVFAESWNGVRYALERPKGTLFDVHPASGAIYLKGHLDFEKASYHNFTVVGKSNSGASARAVVRASVRDRNDHRPMFHKDFYEGRVWENMPAGTVVVVEGSEEALVVSAVDSDKGANAVVSYRVADSWAEDYFTVDYGTGALRTKKELDLETQAVYEFQVLAVDMGSGLLTPVSTLVTVRVSDVNDIPPKLVPDKVRTTLYAPSVPGVFLTQLHAEDGDTVGELSFSLAEEGDGKFEMEESSGIMRVGPGTVKSGKYEIPVSVSDGVHSSSGVVEVEVKELDNRGEGALRFSKKEYHASVMENGTESGPASILVLQTEGREVGEHVSYVLLNENACFSVNGVTGELSTVGLGMDREQTPTKTLVVQARDQRVPPRIDQAIVRVTIQDINDCPPVFFNEPYYAVVSLDAEVGTNVTIIKAVDDDEGKNGEVRYRKLKGSKGGSFFHLDPQSGRITLKRNFPEGMKSQDYFLQVAATDRGDPQLESQAEIRIKVVNKAMPVFDRAFYRLDVSENTTAGTPLLSVVAKSNVGGTVAYSILDGDPESRFDVDYLDGMIMLKKEVDREKRSHYNLTLRAVDVGRPQVHADVPVVVEVRDSNDEKPTFLNRSYRFQVSESFQIGSTIGRVSAVDRDLGRNAHISYRLRGEEAEKFALDSESGDIHLKAPLDFEDQSVFIFQAEAKDGGFPVSLSGSARVEIRVTDVNDNAPRFTEKEYQGITHKIDEQFVKHEFNIRIPLHRKLGHLMFHKLLIYFVCNPQARVYSQAESGHFVTQVSATDADIGSTCLYSITEGEDATYFSLHAKTGTLRLNRSLRALRKTSFHLNVSATDGVFTAHARVNVLVLPGLEKYDPLRFDKLKFEASVKENTPRGTTVVKLRAKGGSGALSYSTSGGAHPFSLDGDTGALTVAGELDFEMKTLYILSASVTDDSGRKAFAQVRVNIVNVNDNAPIFSGTEYTASVSSNASRGDLVLKVMAEDSDVKDVVEYSIVQGSSDVDIEKHFKLNGRNGNIIVRRSLRSLEKKSVKFEIRATDRGNPPLQTEVSVEIYVSSRTEPELKFAEAEFAFTVPEDARMDHDFGFGLIAVDQENLSVKYSVVGGDRIPFLVDDSGVIIVRGKLDREERTEYLFNVRATAGNSKITASVPVRVTVTDVNDNPPIFHGSYHGLEISEDAPLGASVAIVSATDADEGEAGMKEFFLSGTEAEGVFKMDPASGWLILDGPLDREEKDVYAFRVIVRDGGQPALNASTEVKVRVLDANDCPPSFQSPVYDFPVGEGAGVGSVVGRVKASDRDLAPYNTTRIFIVGGNQEGHFGLRSSGEIVIERMLDYEKMKEHRIELLVSDGKYTATTSVNIRVQDENDNAPLCEQDEARLSLSEDVEVGSGVLTMVADDGDSGEFSILNFEVSGSKDFTIDRKGILTVGQSLDRERRPDYSLVVRAVDVGGLYCETAVIIEVTDVNDNPPRFSQPLYEASLKENLESGPHFLLRVLAEDPDLGGAGKVQYALTSKEWGDLFWMDELTGALTVRKPLDREKKALYNLTVMAKDQDPALQLSSTVPVIVRVTDVNDNPPLFTQATYFARVSEEEEEGFHLVSLKATSPEEEKITYRLLAPDSALHWFRMDSKSGALTLGRQLDFEAETGYMVTVEAEDSGKPPLRSRAIVNVTVIDSNDNAPQFSQSLYTATVLENATLGTKVIQVVADDLDSGRNGEVIFKLSPDNVLNENFRVDKETGWLRVKTPLDRETRSQYKILLEAWDRGDTPRTAQAVLNILVGDVNDNAPMFAVCNLTGGILENESGGERVGSVEVEDSDGEGNAAPFHYTLHGEGADNFRVDPDGTIIALSPLHYNKQHTYLLTVEARDSGSPPLSSECPLTILVLEESKHPPELQSVSVEVNSYLGEFPGGELAQARATDKDPRDILTYAILEGDNKSQESFTIDASDGMITAGPGVSVGSHRLNVSASDGKFTSYAEFKVQVNMITEEALEYAVSMKIAGVNTEDFLKRHKRRFLKVIGRLMSARPRNVNLLSIQAWEKPSRRFKRSEGRGMEILFNVRKGSEGFYKPQFIRRKVEGRLGSVGEKLGLDLVSVTTEVCKPGLCVRGQCRERLGMDDVEVVSILADGLSFVAPRHYRSFQCICQEGYGGDLCNIAINSCSQDPCAKWELCIPLESAIRYECVCPAGKTGEKCQESSCADGDCESSMSFDGKSYLRYTLSTAIDKRLQLAIEIRTMAANGIIMTAAGQADFNVLEVRGGFVQYRLDCGSGEGVVRITEVTVTDGNWHLVTVIRRGRHVKLSLDEKFTAEGYSAGRNTIINLDSNDVYFGAEVHQHPTLYGYEEIRQGLTGCLNRIFLDGFQLPRSKPGMRLYNVNFQCSDTFITGVCSSQPCQNFGTCVGEKRDYTCICHPRFTGRNCEMDLNPCASQPCAHGASCENLYNDFFCRCTAGFTGKTCSEVGDFDECISSPCGSNGVCINTLGSFVCNCSEGWSGVECRERDGGPPNVEGNEWGITIPEIIGILVVLVVLILLALLIVLLCRRRASVRYQKAQYLQTVANNEIMLDHPHIRNRLVSGRHFGTGSPGPPPIPPRARGFHPHRNSKLSNLESAQMTGLPTVQVRPLSLTERESPPPQPFRDRWIQEDPGACPARGADAMIGGRNLDGANNYGSAAEELEQLSRFDLMQTFGKQLVPAETAEQNLRNPDNNGSGKLVRRRVPDDWKAALDLLSLDSIERLKAETKAAAQGGEEEREREGRGGGRESDGGAQSMASIQCLPEDDPTQDDQDTGGREEKSYHWDYSDWNSTLGQPGYTMSGASEVMTDDEDGPLPQGVSALDETDSEYVGDSCVENEEDEPSSFPLADIRPHGDFKQQLMALQKLTNRARNSPASSPEKRVGGPAGMIPPEDEYVTMKPIPSSYQKYLPRHRTPPDSSRSQRKPLLLDGGSDSESDSDGADSNQAVVHYGFPKTSGQVAAKLRLHTYDAPADVERGREPLMSSFRDLSKVDDPLQSSMEGQLSQPISTSDISGVCDIEDSEFPESEADDPFRRDVLLSPNSARKQTQV